MTPTWHAIIFYCGYCGVVDQSGKAISGSVSSSDAINKALRKATCDVRIEYFREEIDGLVPVTPWGPTEYHVEDGN